MFVPSQQEKKIALVEAKLRPWLNSGGGEGGRGTYIWPMEMKSFQQAIREGGEEGHCKENCKAGWNAIKAKCKRVSTLVIWKWLKILLGKKEEATNVLKWMATTVNRKTKRGFFSA